MVATFLLTLALVQSPPSSSDTTSRRSNPAAADEPEGERGHGIAYERVSDAFRFDRVQGVSLGLGYRLRVGALPFASLQATARFGLSDERPTGRLTLLREVSGGAVTVSAYHDVADVDVLSLGQTISNTLDAIFVAHDNADYALVTGGAVGWERSLGAGLGLTLRARVERQRSVAREASSSINDWLGGDGEFPENPPIDEGTFGGLQARLAGGGGGPVRWWLATDGLAGAGTSTGRAYGELRAVVGERAGATLRTRAGIATSPTLRQLAFRAGGPATVRGFDYGAQRGAAFWSAQLDVAPVPGRIQPVLFADAGRASAAEDLFSGRVLVGAGAGVSLLHGIIRFDVSRRLSPDAPRLRFDITIGALR